MTAAAAEATQRGWHVFPCEGKAPRPGWRWAEWHTVDPERAQDWLSGTTSYGIACGPSRLVVIDLDTHGTLPEDWQLPGIRDGRDVLVTLCETAGEPWPSTYSVATPSGGWHLYFAADPARKIGNSAGQLGPMVDVRGDGGYVVGAGSVTGDGAYECFDQSPPVPLPGWLAAACEPPSRQHAPAPPAAVPRDTEWYIAAALEAELRAVATAWEGSRNHQLNKSAWAVARLVAAGQLDSDAAISALTQAATAAGLSATETRRTLRSAFTARSARRG